MPSIDLAARARDWAIWLTEQPSVTGSIGEQELPLRLQARIRQILAFDSCETWLIPAPNDLLNRACFALLVPGRGAETVLLTGHFDTVTTDDYGDLTDLATQPEALREALLARLATSTSPAEALARSDLESGEFLPGRGLLDMKAGLAAGLAAAETFALDPERQGNLLFVAVPDEEVNSVGARALAAALPGLQKEKGLNVRAAINLDCIGDIGDGSTGRAVALGSVGKLLLTALIVGLPSHASHPFQGLNAGVLAAAIATRIEWAPELTGGRPGVPPVLLSLKDNKQRYDVTTPEMSFATWNVLTQGRGAAEMMAAFEQLVGEALVSFLAESTRRRAAITGQTEDAPAVPVIHTSQLIQEALGIAGGAERLNALGLELQRLGLSLLDQNERLTQEAWRLTGRTGPCVILGYGSLPYPAVRISQEPGAVQFLAAIEAARHRAVDRSGESITFTSFFPGISDMSFIGEASTADLGLISANTPAWATGLRWPGEVGGVPIVNIGPWGRDYHTPLERVHQRYAFQTLPPFLLDAVQSFLREAS